MIPGRGTRTARKLLAVLALAAGGLPALAQDVREIPDETRPFALPLARDARTFAEQASEHLRAQRWSEAIAILQRMVEEHAGEVLPETYRETFDQHSEHAAHPGASDWARRQLRTLPQEARMLYRERYGPRADRALELALSRRSRRAMVDVARLWPISSAAVRAWWILGDLELEQGHARAALIAWKRAAETMELVDEAPPTGAEARRRAALELVASESADPDSGEPPPTIDEILNGEDPTLARGPLPEADSRPWSKPLDLEPFEKRQYYHPLLPVISGERVFVDSTLRAYAVDTFTGEELWQAGPPPGWERLTSKRRDELFAGLNHKQLLVAPAVGGKVCLAALQIPYSDEANENWQGIEIRVAIPERRLFAFDVENGAELWNHAPELAWNPTSEVFTWDGRGTFAQRMRVAGPPVIAGTRVLVPCYRMQGRIDYHVACYELETGQLLWSTSVVSGQRPRNMFGRAREEFCASPLVVAGERVIAQTELGTVAALDLMTGEILWESLYRQIALPPTRSYQSPNRDVLWRLAPPVVVDGVVVSTPSDSPELVMFDVTDGRVLYTTPQSSLVADSRNSQLNYNLLLGADRTTVYLGGQMIGALRKSGGLRSTRLFDPTSWSVAVDTERNSDLAARALLCRDSILVPLPGERKVIDRSSGMVNQSLGAVWDRDHYGNALAERGFIVTLSAVGLSGFFDWNALVARQRERQARDPADPAVALETARLYARRAEAVYEEGDLFTAWSFLEESREILKPLQERLKDEDGMHLLRRTGDELFAVLCLEARVLEDQGRRTPALEALAQAEPLATTRTALRDTLLQEERILRSTNEDERRLGVLDSLAERCADLPLPALRLAETLDLTRLLVDPEAGRREIPVGLWVRFARGEINLRAGRLPAALEDWHAVVEEYGEIDVAPGLRAEALAADEIHRVLLLPDGRIAYEPFERKASERYARALEEEDPVQLEEVSRLFPHSRAALDAMRARLEWAFARNETDVVARIVYQRLATTGGEDPGDHALLLRLGRAIGRLGNTDFERGLLAALVREDPGMRSDLEEDEGRTVREVLDRLTQELPPSTPLEPQFDSSVIPSRGGPLEGDYAFLGRILPVTEPPESLPEEIHVYLKSLERIEAFSNLSAEEPAWSFPLQEPVRGVGACCVATGRVVVGGMSALWGIDGHGGLRWMRETDGRPVQALASRAGIVLALVGATDPEAVLAFDANAGIPLWERHLGADGRWSGPVFGEGMAVFFSQVFGRPARARVLDLFRGSTRAELDLGKIPNNDLDESAWVAGRNLVVPNFARYEPEQSGAVAYDLSTGRVAWKVSLRETEIFWAIAYHGDDDYLITLTDSNTNGAVYALDTQNGTLRTIVPIRPGEEPIGLDDRKRTELPAPILFTLTEVPGSQEVPVRAIHLPNQARWTWTLPFPFDELYHGEMPLPAVSAACVALAFVRKNPNGFRGEAMMVFLDRETGTRQDSLILHQDFSHASGLELRGLGESLFVAGRGSALRGHRLEILEKIR